MRWISNRTWSHFHIIFELEKHHHHHSWVVYYISIKKLTVLLCYIIFFLYRFYRKHHNISPSAAPSPSDPHPYWHLWLILVYSGLFYFPSWDSHHAAINFPSIPLDVMNGKAILENGNQLIKFGLENIVRLRPGGNNSNSIVISNPVRNSRPFHKILSILGKATWEILFGVKLEWFLITCQSQGMLCSLPPPLCHMTMGNVDVIGRGMHCLLI